MLTSILLTILICQGGPDDEFMPGKCTVGVVECTVKDAKDIDKEVEKCFKQK